MTADEPTRRDWYSQQLRSVTKTIQAVRGPLLGEETLTTKQQETARRLLYVTSNELIEARRVLLDSEPHMEDQVTHLPAVDDTDEAPDEWDDTDEALGHIERCLSRVLRNARDEDAERSLSSSILEKKFETALGNIMAVREIHPAVSTVSIASVDVTDIHCNPDELEVTGRGVGDGRWLESQLQGALHRWGYYTDTRQTLFGLEVDVVATRNEKQHKPTDWIVAQCKDWTNAPITPKTLFRLCTVAFACRAMPVLCHTTELTSRTAELARRFEVRVLDLDDLQRAELPTPFVAKPTPDLNEGGIQYRARDHRGTLPSEFRSEPGKRFSYVPGFTPVGDADYEPIESDLDDDTHPAAGH